MRVAGSLPTRWTPGFVRYRLDRPACPMVMGVPLVLHISCTRECCQNTSAHAYADYACMYTCMYVTLYACMHACMHVPMCVCVYIYTNTYVFCICPRRCIRYVQVCAQVMCAWMHALMHTHMTLQFLELNVRFPDRLPLPNSPSTGQLDEV